MNDRRHSESILKSIVFPIIVAVCTGVASSYVAISVALGIIETRLEYIESDVVTMKNVLIKISDNQITLANHGARLDAIERLINTARITTRRADSHD